MQKYTRFDAQSFYDAMIFNMDSIGKYMLELILHQQRTLQLLKQKKLMQTQEDHSNPIPVLNVDSLKVDLVVIQNTCSEKVDSNSETASSKLVKECSLNSETKDVHAIKYKMSKAKERCMAYFVAAMVGMRHQGTYTTIILYIKEHKKDAPGVVSLDDVYPDQISEILEHLQRTGAPKVAKQTLPGANVALTGREAPWIPHLRAYMSATYSSTGGSRARALYKAGLRTPQAIAEAFIPEIAKTIFESALWDAQVLEKAEEARDAAFSAFKALGVDVPQFPMNIIKKEPITSSREIQSVVKEEPVALFTWTKTI
ncbi:hypothetical protein Tco_1161480 [Tanacetum coccineum]